jgi:hypothetical protein
MGCCGGQGVSPLLLVLLGEEERRGGRDVGEEGSQLGMLWSRDKDEERGGSHGEGRAVVGSHQRREDHAVRVREKRKTMGGRVHPSKR